MAKAPHPRRRIGRPRQGAGRDARALLLDAAMSLFAKQGVAGTTVAEIAKHAGLTPAMVHYYFTNREQLVDALAEERLIPTITAVWAPVVESHDVASMLRGLVHRIFEAARANPSLPSLWLREVATEGGQLRARIVELLPFQYLQHLVSTIAAAQRRGEINAQIEPRLVLVSVIGNTLLPLAASPLWQQLPMLRNLSLETVARHSEALLVTAFSRSASDPTTA